jgi:ribosomal protein S18 acetylase RimI-like enzyme
LSTPKVSLLFPEQYVKAATVLGRAFVNDPLTRAIVVTGDMPERVLRMTRLFEVILKSHQRAGQPVLGVMHEGRVAAVAIIEQTVKPPSTASIVLHGMALLPALGRVAGFGGLVRSVTALDVLTRNRPIEPHLYLNVLGVEPEHQGRHLGTALLEFIREQASLRPELAGVYLETGTEANVSYYTRFGYRVLSEIQPIGVREWRMMQPRSK